MNKKLLFLTVLLVFALLPNFGLARDTDYTPGASFAWSPYSWNVNSYVDSSDSSEIVASFEKVKFNQTATDLHNGAYYLTFEINNTTDNVPHNGWYSSNIPYAKYDKDDDNGNGYSEEIEAIKSYVGAKINANQEYYFRTSWFDSTDEWGEFDMIIQRSVVNPLNGEFEGYHYDFLETRYWFNF
ncbi:MAG TPA: hypothetical protein VKZ77_13390 [Bacillaceae bacterium]|nr:hypothetical protein [Paenibacillus bovis]HLU23452.1 hypothetical protein [Bacillaceae bacterium]